MDKANFEWLNYFDDNQASYVYEGITIPAKGVHAGWISPTSSTMVEGAAMLDSGVIFLGSAGNNNNQQVKGDHPNYNNYVCTDVTRDGVTYSATNRTLSQAEEFGEMVNRVSNPNCIGNVPNYNGGGVDVYRTFNIGALEEDTISNGDGSYREVKAAYSNMGNAVDFYTIGDGSIAAQGGGSGGYDRNDSSYRLDSNYNIVQSVELYLLLLVINILTEQVLHVLLLQGYSQLNFNIIEIGLGVTFKIG